MKAAVHTTYGPPSVVQISEVRQPSPGVGEVLIKVHATTVNRTDCAYRGGKPFLARAAYGPFGPRVQDLGNEFAGRIDEVGAGVSEFTVGDRVFGYNEGPFGAHAEYLVMAESGSLTTMPEGTTYQEIAPAFEGAHYALSMINAAKILSGQRVLVYGATGGIGSAAVQLLNIFGMEVTAVCPAEHVELVRGLGADRVIDLQSFVTDDRTYDVVIDAVGKTSLRCLQTITHTARNLPLVGIGSIFAKPVPGNHHPLAPRQESQVPDSDAQPANGAVLQGLDRVRTIHPTHRPDLSAGTDRRGLRVRRNRPETGQRRDHRRSGSLTAGLTVAAGKLPSAQTADVPRNQI